MRAGYMVTVSTGGTGNSPLWRARPPLVSRALRSMSAAKCRRPGGVIGKRTVASGASLRAAPRAGHSRACRSFNVSISRSRSRGAFRVRVFEKSAPEERRGARDAGSSDCRRSLPGPTGLTASRRSGGTMLFDEAPSEVQNRKSANSPASRTRCLKPAPHGPRWSLLFRLPSLSGAEASPPLGDHRQLPGGR